MQGEKWITIVDSLTAAVKPIGGQLSIRKKSVLPGFILSFTFNKTTDAEGSAKMSNLAQVKANYITSVALTVSE